jgi:hypothetical protein
MKTVALPCRTGLAPIAALVLPAWLAVFPLGGWSADLPKQGTFTVTYTDAGTSPAGFDTGGGKWANRYLYWDWLTLMAHRAPTFGFDEQSRNG